MGCAALICFASAIVAFGIAFVWWQHNQNFAQNAERVEGFVVEVRENRNRDGIMYSPVIEFTDYLGQQQKFHSKASSSTQQYFVGDKVEVLYDRDNPGTAMIDNWWELNLLPLVLVVPGISNVLFSILLAIIALVVYRYRPRNSKSNTVPVSK